MTSIENALKELSEETPGYYWGLYFSGTGKRGHVDYVNYYLIGLGSGDTKIEFTAGSLDELMAMTAHLRTGADAVKDAV